MGPHWPPGVCADLQGSVLTSRGLHWPPGICTDQSPEVCNITDLEVCTDLCMYVCMYYNHGRSTVGVAITAQSPDQVQ